MAVLTLIPSALKFTTVLRFRYDNLITVRASAQPKVLNLSNLVYNCWLWAHLLTQNSLYKARILKYV